MRSLLVLLAISLIGFSCGEAGFGINISKDFPVEIPMSFTGADFPATGNPPASPPITETYDMSEVGVFDGELDSEIALNQIAFEMTDIDPGEEVNMDDFTIDLLLNGGQRLSLSPDMNRLENQNYTVLVPRGDGRLGNVLATLESSKRLGFEVIFDFAEVPASNLDFNYKLYFDVTLKVRP